MLILQRAHFFQPAVLAILAPALLAGCAAKTAVTSTTWHDSAQRDVRYSKVIVVALTEEGDKRLSFEDELAFDLRSDATQVWPSSRLMDVKLPVNSESLTPVVAETGAEVVVVTRVTSFDVKSVEQASAYTDVSARRRQGSVFQYDYVEKELPALITTEFTTVLTTDVVAADDGALIYTVVTTASGQETIADVINVLSDVIAKQLRRDGVIR